MNREEIAREMLKLAKMLSSGFKKPTQTRDVAKTPESESYDEFRGSGPEPATYPGDRIFKSYRGKVKVQKGAKRFYVYVGGSESAAKSKGKKLLRELSISHSSVPPVDTYDFYVGYDGGVAKVGRKKTASNRSPNMEAEVARNGLAMFKDVEKVLSKYARVWGVSLTKDLDRRAEGSYTGPGRTGDAIGISGIFFLGNIMRIQVRYKKYQTPQFTWPTVETVELSLRKDRKEILKEHASSSHGYRDFGSWFKKFVAMNTDEIAEVLED